MAASSKTFLGSADTTAMCATEPSGSTSNASCTQPLVPFSRALRGYSGATYCRRSSVPALTMALALPEAPACVTSVSDTSVGGGACEEGGAEIACTCGAGAAASATGAGNGVGGGAALAP